MDGSDYYYERCSQWLKVNDQISLKQVDRQISDLTLIFNRAESSSGDPAIINDLEKTLNLLNTARNEFLDLLGDVDTSKPEHLIKAPETPFEVDSASDLEGGIEQFTDSAWDSTGLNDTAGNTDTVSLSANEKENKLKELLSDNALGLSRGDKHA